MMHTLSRLSLFLLVLVPATALARVPQEEANVNTRYKVESVSIAGVADTRVSQSLRDDMQKLVGQQYDPKLANELAERLREELHDRTVSLKVKRGDQPEHVTVIFEVRREDERHFVVQLAPLLFSTTDRFSVAIVPSVEVHHNVVTGGYVSNADELLERNEGWLVRYEHRKIGTSMVQAGVEYDYFHPSFRARTIDALAVNPQVPGVYRTREVFSPAVSFLPIPDIRLTFGATFQLLAMDGAAAVDRSANAFTFGAQFRHAASPSRRVRNEISADFSVRRATTALETDLVYTRQWAAADYSVSIGRHHEFGFHFQGGHTSGTPPLFERFSLGNTSTLRGWDKFDVAPLGGTRLAYGSLEYYYRPFVLFYDFGSVWDDGQTADVKHAVGIGIDWKRGFFMSLGFPLRYHDVTPVFMIGIRR